MTALSHPTDRSDPAPGSGGPGGAADRHRPRLTVLVATYNRAAYLTLALESVLGQSFSDFEVRVVDDASQDTTPEVIAGIRDPRVRSFRQRTNQGWLGNCNAALEGVDTEYVLLLGDDDVMTPGALERAVAVLDANPDVGMVHTALNIIDGAGRLIRSVVNWTKDPNVDTKEPGQEFIRKSIRSGCRVCAATVMMRTAALAGMRFEPADGPTADVGLWLRIARR